MHYINKLHHILSLLLCFIVTQYAYSAVYCLPNGLSDFQKRKTQEYNKLSNNRSASSDKARRCSYGLSILFPCTRPCVWQTLVIKINVQARNISKRPGAGSNFAYSCSCFWARLKKYLKLLITKLSLLTNISGKKKSLLTNKRK